jgi:hypothetical protein
VGIGTTTPQAALQVAAGAIMPSIGNGPTSGIYFPTDPGGGAFDEAFIRYFAVSGETTKFLIGCGNDADDSIGFFQAGAERLTITNGSVGIGTASPRGSLHVFGDLYVEGQLFFPLSKPPLPFLFSDLRLKDDIEPLTGALDKLLQLRSVTFLWKEPEKMGNVTGRQIGLIAQEVETVFPEWVLDTPNGYKALVPKGFEALVVEALRELSGRLDKLEQASASSKKSGSKS